MIKKKSNNATFLQGNSSLFLLLWTTDFHICLFLLVLASTFLSMFT
jgi:hypothetical protein